MPNWGLKPNKKGKPFRKAEYVKLPPVRFSLGPNTSGGRIQCRRCGRFVFNNPDGFKAHGLSCVRLHESAR